MIRQQYLKRIFSLLSATATLVGCQGPLDANNDLISEDQLFWSLTIDHKAVNLGTVSPYDTIQLTAIARNVKGEVLADAPKPTFSPSPDLAISIDPNGLIRARTQTTASGLRAVASVTYKGVTRTDTAFITVTTSPAVLPIREYTLRVSNGDSTLIAASWPLLDERSKRLFLNAIDTSNNSVSRVIGFFSSSDENIAKVDRQNGTVSIRSRPGTVWIRSSSMIYGTPKSDSILLTVRDQLLGMMILRNGITTYKTTIAEGGDVLWLNATSDSIDIQFEDSLAAQRPKGSTGYGLIMSDTHGNIAAFPGNPKVDLFSINPTVLRARSFPTAGTYRFTSKRNPAFHGTIEVKPQH